MRRFPYPLAAILLASIAAHWLLWPYSGRDMGVFLLPWFQHIQQAGPIGAFATPFSDYAPPYLYLMAATTPLAAWVDPVDLIKGLSVAGSFALALSVWRLLRVAMPGGRDIPQRTATGAALVVLLPTVTLNAALLGQCDAMWTAPCVMALAAAIERRHLVMLAWCGLALGIKLQAIFFAPFIVALLIQRRVPLVQWLMVPAVWLATLLPAWLAGWPAGDLLTIYLRQAGAYQEAALVAPTIWMIIETLPPFTQLPLSGLAFAAAIGAAAAYVAWLSATPLGGRRLMEAALLAPLIVVGLLPRMHERYFFLADIIAVAIALVWPDRRSITIAILVQAGSLLALLAYIVGLGGFAMFGAAAMILATVQLARPLLRRPANDNIATGMLAVR